jgi:hypothetical protein
LVWKEGKVEEWINGKKKKFHAKCAMKPRSPRRRNELRKAELNMSLTVFFARNFELPVFYRKDGKIEKRKIGGIQPLETEKSKAKC